jgi:hypothetical protein
MDNSEADVNPDVSNESKDNTNDESENNVIEEVEDVEEVESEDANVLQDMSSVQIAPTAEINEVGNEYNPLLFIELGDIIVVDSKKYGRTIGTVYYRSYELIRVKPYGVSNRLHDFELEQTDEEEIYKEEDGVTNINIIQKRQFDSFVEQQDFRIDQVIDTFDKEGNIYKSYKIVGVDKENDFIKIQDEEDPETERDLNFNFIGIEPDEDFVVISIREFVGPKNKVPVDSAPELESSFEENDVEENENETEEFEILGDVTVTLPRVYREAASYEQRIPDNLQKVDALNDFINSLDPTLQKDPRAIRNMRILVETLFNLGKETIEYEDDGTIMGPKTVSPETLSQLIEQVKIPLGRPILKVSKKFYRDTDLDTFDDELENADETDEAFFVDYWDELDSMISPPSSVVGSIAGNKTIVKHWVDTRDYLKKYGTPWSANDEIIPLWSAYSDSEFFRVEPPSTIELSSNSYELLSIIPGYIGSKSSSKNLVFDKIPFGIERALSATYRKSVNRRKELLLSSEDAAMESYMLFPYRVVNSLGKTRSYHLAIDSGRSHMPMKTMKMILEEIGEPVDIGSSTNQIILLKTEEETLGNIPVTDYIEGLSVPGLGLGDVFYTLEQYGINELELNTDIAEVLLAKINSYQSQLLTSLNTLRETLKLEEQKQIEVNQFITNPEILETIRSQTILNKALNEYKKLNPTLADSDLGQVVYLTKKYDNYFQVTAGKNAILTARATKEANNNIYIDYLRVNSIIRFNKKNAGERPKINKCPHVADLVSVRKIKDDADRFYELTKVFKKFQGVREENWIKCNSCKDNLLCIHERLQLQAYLSPKEKGIIEKDIILKCAGGQFQGKYICRNCGQGIRDLDFDNNLEYDDDGKPRSGRAVLVDEDALLDEKIEQLVGIPIEDSETVQLKLNSDEVLYYNVIREIAEKVGIRLENKVYPTIISRAMEYMAMNMPTRAVYASLGQKIDYDVVISRFMISSCALFLLIEIQTRIPPYVIRYVLSGCESPGFGGHPLDPNEENLQGVKYLACAINAINRNTYPWNRTLFYQSQKDTSKRIKSIATYLLKVLNIVKDNGIIQQELVERRKYSKDISGAILKKIGEDEIEDIPPSFLPEQKVLTVEESAKNVIQPEVAETMGNKGKMALVRLWIRQAHLLAKETVSIIKGSPLLETTCCINNILLPGDFWNKFRDMLPELGKRKLVPNQQGQFLMTEFIPREDSGIVAEPDKELYYRLFLKYCFEGPRKGYLHEPGLTNRCMWCGFQFPTNPRIMDIDKEGKMALTSQEKEIKTNTEDFNGLLDQIHIVNRVESVEKDRLLSVEQVMREFGEIEPEPIDGWADIINRTTSEFLKLTGNIDRSEIALAAGPISEATLKYEMIIDNNLKRYKPILDDIIKLPWDNFFQVLQNYFILPFQRILTGYVKESIFIPRESKRELAESHIEDIETFLKMNMNAYQGTKKNPVLSINDPRMSLAKGKITYFVNQMSSILDYKYKLRPIILPGREYTLDYIKSGLLYGPLGGLIDSSKIPDGLELRSSIKEIGDESMIFILRNIMFYLEKYKSESLSYDDEKIRELIAIREEKERVQVIKEFDVLTPEERAVELMNKKLGLGKWAVGGTKAIWAYDKDNYDKEREDRSKAGIIDFPGTSDGQSMIPEGRDHNEFGFPVYDDMEFEREGGYDHNQHGDDDYE